MLVWDRQDFAPGCNLVLPHTPRLYNTMKSRWGIARHKPFLNKRLLHCFRSSRRFSRRFSRGKSLPQSDLDEGKKPDISRWYSRWCVYIQLGEFRVCRCVSR